LRANDEIDRKVVRNPGRALELASLEWRRLVGIVLDGLKQVFFNFGGTADKLSGPVAIVAVSTGRSPQKCKIKSVPSILCFENFRRYNGQLSLHSFCLRVSRKVSSFGRTADKLSRAVAVVAIGVTRLGRPSHPCYARLCTCTTFPAARLNGFLKKVLVPKTFYIFPSKRDGRMQTSCDVKPSR
jgi:hypothetical protein